MGWTSTRVLVGALAVGFVVRLPAQAAAAADYAAVEKRFLALMERRPLGQRTQGRCDLALTGDPRAFATLARQYAKPEAPEDCVRSLLVTILADFFRAPAPPVAAWRELRTAHAEASDAWLWHRSLRIEGDADPTLWQTLASAKLPIELRAVAMTAAARRSGGAILDDAALDVIFTVGAGIGARSYERSLLLEALVGLFEGQAGKLGKPQRTLLRSLVHAMGESSTSPRSRIVLARTLARALGRDNIGPDAAGWIDLLADAPTEQIEMAYARKRAAARPGFFGITEHGRSIAYVIDASDSMLQPLSPSERADLMPLTGPDAGKGAVRVGAQAERAIDWDRVRTRFDGARELLKLALRELGKEHQFTVVLFGDSDRLLDATPRLMTATARTVDAACRELDAIKPGPATTERPLGTLLGNTNLHGGLVRALQITSGKAEGKADGTWLDPRTFELGADTIYLLSDGAPNCDDFDCVDTYDGKVVQDAETGKTQPGQGSATFSGPFAAGHYLVADLQRLNLLRRCAIHAVGLGEADYDLLKRIAESGHGTTVEIGRKKK